jgi:hypothetical protein
MAAHLPEAAERWDTIIETHRQLAQVVEELDKIELHHAAAHVSMALDIMRRAFPELARH